MSADLSQIFPVSSISKTEEVLISEIFCNPLVKKYLRLLAISDTKELLTLSAISTDDSKLIKAHATVQGRLQILGTLLSIEVVTQNPNQTSV